MPTAKHRIGRQVFELSVADERTARLIQEGTARLHRTRLLPELSRWLDALAPADRTVRIERLSLDLGRLPAEGFDSALIAALGRALPSAMAEALAERSPANTDPAEASELELIEHLLASGNLPWWGDPTRNDVLDAALEHCVRTAQAPLAALLRRRLAAGAQARRAALHLRQRRLASLVDLLAPGRGTDARDIVAALLRAVPPGERRRLFIQLWGAVLQTAASGAEGRLGFWRDSLARLAAVRGVGLRPLLQWLMAGEGGLPTPGSVVGGSAAELLGRLIAELPPARAAAIDAETVIARIAVLIGRGLGPVALLSHLERALKRRPAAAAALADLADALAGALGRRDADATFAAAGALLARGRALDLLPADAVADSIARWAQTPDGLDPRRIRALAEGAPKASLSRPSSVATSEDELQVTNSGLAILWPFLTAFFARLDLLDGRAFRDDTAAARAVGLLEFVAAADPRPPEYRLCLNKLLCGLDPHRPWPADGAGGGSPCGPEREECAGLLDAVIASAPILKSMSHDGLRGSFLLRPGVLRQDAAGWLLRVERRSYDLVLDRFPWPIGWVRLPWMPAPLRVDW